MKGFTINIYNEIKKNVVNFNQSFDVQLTEATYAKFDTCVLTIYRTNSKKEKRVSHWMDYSFSDLKKELDNVEWS